ncbi:MAG: AEC family transporter [Deferribacteraceae bacterium]|jgi:predicted permease|nr:AEC family transporter [Deferribacteraceae bacterium]
MLNFALIFICLLAGFIISRTKLLPEGSYRSINVWLLYIALPALSLRYIPHIDWGAHILFAVFAPLLMWGGAWLLVNIYARVVTIPAATKTAMLLLCGLANTSFFGFPIITAYYGESGVQDAIIFDQVTFLIFSTLGVLTVLKSSAGGVSPKVLLRRIVTFPPFIACIIAVVVPQFIDISGLDPLLDRIVGTLSPLALFSIGLQMNFTEIKSELRELLVCLSYKLLLAPTLVLLLALVMSASGNFARINIMESAMPAHITASLLASQFNQNPRLCNLCVCVGLILAFFTTFFWWMITGYIFS